MEDPSVSKLISTAEAERREGELLSARKAT